MVMDDERIRLVARNLREFMALHLYDELLLLNEFANEETYYEYKSKEESSDQQSAWFDHARWRREKEQVRDTMRNVFGFEPIAQPYPYIQDIRLERSMRTIMTTKDSVGVMASSASKDFGEQTALLAAVRHLQHDYCTDRDVIKQHAQALKDMGLRHEAEALVERLLG
ncbi:hypothetical protein ACX1C1_21940 [Paenibacillus sp. strain BS8-2]